MSYPPRPPSGCCFNLAQEARTWQCQPSTIGGGATPSECRQAIDRPLSGKREGYVGGSWGRYVSLLCGAWSPSLHRRFDELAADLAVLDRLWTDDLLVNSPLNLVNDKPRTLALLEAGRIRHTSLTSEIEHMARHNDIVDVVRQEPATRTNGAEPAK